MEEKAAIVSLAALAQPMRLRVFRALVGAGPRGMTPSALSAMLVRADRDMSHTALISGSVFGRRQQPT